MNALKAFDAAARRKGFTAAAQELLVSPGAISRHVSNLEEYFGVPLFERHHNEIELTRAGQFYYARIRSALDVIEDASRQMEEGVNARQVRVSTLPTFATRWLIPRLSRFIERHPQVELQLSTGVAQLDEINFELDAIDIATHFSISEIAADHTDLLFETELHPVCTPELAKRITGASDMLEQRLLFTVNGLTHWRQWFEVAGLPAPAKGPRMSFGNSGLALQAAIEGLGVALSESVFVRDDLAAGRLVSPVDQRLRISNKYYMTVNPARAENAGVRAFREWLLEEIRTT
ncbi:MAG: LysR substrate-binding domain-containing protein [Methylococcaceae bacterium]|nr:LysR substrate-binding domain-containing protein [Methylococcaceae bacterium]